MLEKIRNNSIVTKAIFYFQELLRKMIRERKKNGKKKKRKIKENKNDVKYNI